MCILRSCVCLFLNLCSLLVAQVTLKSSEKLRIIPHPLYDPHTFSSLASLYDVAKREGYQARARRAVAVAATVDRICAWCRCEGGGGRCEGGGGCQCQRRRPVARSNCLLWPTPQASGTHQLAVWWSQSFGCIGRSLMPVYPRGF